VKITTIFLLAALTAAVTAPAAVAQTKYIAVVETEVDAQSGAAAILNKAEVREITAVLRNEARNILPPGKYKLMDSESIIAQGSAKLEECSEENCVVVLGNKIGADYIVRGTVSKFQTKITLSVLMYETEDGTLVASTRVSSDKAEELLDKTVAACGGMYRTFLSEMGATAQKAPPPTTTQQPSQVSFGTVTDRRDGKTYKTVEIGGKRWMGENMNYQTSSGSWCYKNDNSKCGEYGRLYDWKTAKSVCLSGYHLPSRAEWDNLVGAAGAKGVAGKKLKARRGWNYNGNGTDDFGFSALSGGSRNYNDGSFYGAGTYGNWWATTEDGGGYAYRWYIYYNYDNVYENYNDKGYGFSVRCVAD